MAITYPTEPTFSDQLKLPPVPEALEPFVWVAYGSVVQDLIDKKIKDFSVYYTPIAIVRAEWAVEKDTLFRKYHRARKALLTKEGQKNNAMLPGYVQRNLMDLSLDEKRDLSLITAKIMEKYTEASSDGVFAASELAMQSEELRADMHYEIQAASYEVALAALLAGYEQSKLTVSRFSASLKAIETEFKILENYYKSWVQAIKAEISEVQVLIEQAQLLGHAEELQQFEAELAAALKSVEVEQSRLPLVEAELAKAEAQLSTLEAEKALAVFKELTAQASMEKSQARLQDIEVSKAKIELEVAKVGLQALKETADTDSELSRIDNRSKEEAISNARATIQLITTQADIDLTAIRSRVLKFQKEFEQEMKSYYEERAGAVKDKVESRATVRVDKIESDATTIVAKLSDLTTNSVQNIEDTTTSTTEALYTSTETAVSLMGQSADNAVANVEQEMQAQQSALESKLSGHINTISTKEDAILAQISANESTLLTEIEGYASYSGQAQIIRDQASSLINGIDQIRGALVDTSKDLTAAFKSEAESIKSAAQAAANATVTSTLNITG